MTEQQQAEFLRKIFVGIHGWGGAGKTWLAHTLPGPRLEATTENGSWDTAHRTDRVIRCRRWDPLTEPVPADLTPEDTVIVNIRDLESFGALIMLLKSGNHPFESFILDSFTSMQGKVKKVVAAPGHDYDPNAVFDHQAWGRLKNNGLLLLEELMNLTWPDSPKPINVGVVMFSDEESVPAVPLLEGGVRKGLVGLFDLFGYLFTAIHPETKEEIRVLQIARSPDAQAKCRLHSVKVKYGTHIEQPDLIEILATLNTEETQ